jgi:hypothetical protein
MIKRLKSGIMFILPNKRLQARSAPKEVGLQLERLQAAGVDARSGGSDMGEAVAT